MKTQQMIRRLLIFTASIALLVFASVDTGYGGLLLVLAIFTALIFLELFFIRSTILRIYAESIGRNPLLLAVLKGRIVNTVVTGVISVYLASNLLLHLHTGQYVDFLLLAISGLLIASLADTATAAATPVFQQHAAVAFSRIGLIMFVVFVMITLDGFHNAFGEVDARIQKSFDVDIPSYVIEDVQHSATWFQHLLRTHAYFEMNLESLALQDGLGPLPHIVRFLAMLTPTPFIAYALLLMSLFSLSITIKRIPVEESQ